MDLDNPISFWSGRNKTTAVIWTLRASAMIWTLKTAAVNGTSKTTSTTFTSTTILEISTFYWFFPTTSIPTMMTCRFVMLTLIQMSQTTTTTSIGDLQDWWPRSVSRLFMTKHLSYVTAAMMITPNRSFLSSFMLLWRK